MTPQQSTQISKFLSLILRHKPETIGLQLDDQGWANVSELLHKMTAHNHSLSPSELQEAVRTNAKQRFTLSEDGTKIRASQGHSVDVDLGLTPQQPPELLYHGTVATAVPTILKEGLRKMSRQHVHLSKDQNTAIVVGQRRGKPIILTIKSGEMYSNGFPFFLSANSVWLTEAVPPQYINTDPA